MMQFLNNIWISLSTENAELVNLLLIPATIIEAYLFMNLFLTIFNLNTNIYNKILYIFLLSLEGIVFSSLLTSPFNVILNYICVLLLLIFIFKLTLLKSFIALFLSAFTLGLLNMLFQNSL